MTLLVRRLLIIGIAVAVAAFLALESAGWYLAHRSGRAAGEAGPEASVPEGARLEKEIAQLRKRIAAAQPKGPYIVVDTARNTLHLRDGERTILQSLVSCGSGNVLKDPSGKKTWTFDTPRGEFDVRSKVENPAWIKPDWAFVEEGEKIPPKGDISRVETGVLGSYAMGFGNGYFIHGTLYTRLLGRNVTHGCIRVREQDLEQIFNTVRIGSKVFIF